MVRTAPPGLRGGTVAPTLLPIFRSQQQAVLLALMLGNPECEYSITDLVGRAESAGLVSSRLVGHTRMVRADTSSPYFLGLADVLVRAFGPPWVVGELLSRVPGVDAAFIYGSWAARFSGHEGTRSVGDIDVLALGEPDRDALYGAMAHAERRLGRPGCCRSRGLEPPQLASEAERWQSGRMHPP